MSSSQQQQSQPRFYLLRELICGGLTNAISSSILNPMDVIKIRMQTEGSLKHSISERKYKTFSGSLGTILKEEGILGLYLPGLVASILRELSYSSLRIGLYTPIKNNLLKYKNIDNTKSNDIGIINKIIIGLMTGSIGSAIATPTDLVKIRFQKEAGKIVNGIYTTGLRKDFAPTYRNTFNAFYSIYKNENGIRGLYKGCTPTIIRASLLTSAQLATYDHTKYLLKYYSILNEGIYLHIIASLTAGFTATTICAPIDMIKTRIMCDYDKIYKNSFDCFIQLIRHEGYLSLFKGWLPSYARIGPHFIIVFPLLEQMRRLFGLGYFATNNTNTTTTNNSNNNNNNNKK